MGSWSALRGQALDSVIETWEPMLIMLSGGVGRRACLPIRAGQILVVQPLLDELLDATQSRRADARVFGRGTLAARFGKSLNGKLP
jgi:hypothetical protein